MNVLIGGDSYGVPSEYVHERLSLAKDLSSLKPPYHIYHHLQQDKHTVHSMALCGTSASYSLHRLEQWLSGEVPERVYVTNKIPDIQTRNISELNNPKISYDLLIYFQPPLMRDFENFNKDMVLQKAVLTHAHTVYKNLARIIEKYQIPKLALIGGAARIMDPYKHYLTPDYFKECWIQDILGTEGKDFFTIKIDFGYTRTFLCTNYGRPAHV